MTIDDKLNILYNEIKIRKIYNYKIESNIKIEYLNNIIKEQNFTCFENYEKKLENKNEIQTIYNKIGQIFELQAKLYENMIKEFNQIKNIIEKKISYKLDFNENKETQKEKDENNINITPFGNDEEENNFISLKYKVDKIKTNSVTLFGNDFIKKK